MIKVFLDFYFAPKFFEKNGRFYEFLGVHIFKKFLPTFGDYVVRLTGSSVLSGRSTKSLKTYEMFTRIYETAHLALCILMISMLLKHFTIFVFVTNLAINVYPILTQRYNRAKVYKILRKKEKRQFFAISTQKLIVS